MKKRFESRLQAVEVECNSFGAFDRRRLKAGLKTFSEEFDMSLRDALKQ
jgi:hypothetical protein